MNDETAPAASRAFRLIELFSLVLLWNSAYKGVRVLNTLYALELGAKPFDIGLLLATYGLFALLLAVYAGRVSDRYGVRLPVIGGVLTSTVGIALPYFSPTLGAVFASAAITGLGFIFVQVGLQTLTGSLAAGAARTRNINIYALVVSTADFAGPVIAGFAIDHTGHAVTYLWLAVLSAAALIGLSILARRFPRGSRAARGKGQRRMADLLRIGRLRRVFVASAVVMTGLDLFQLYMPLYGHSIGLSASAIGLVLGAFAVAGFAMRALMPLIVRWLGEEKALVWSIACAGVAFIPIPFVDNGYALGALSFALGLGMALGQPLSVVLAYNYSPPGRAGETIGLRIAINNSMHVVVPTAFGGIGSLIGIAPMFWLSSAMLGLGAYVAGRKRA